MLYLVKPQNTTRLEIWSTFVTNTGQIDEIVCLQKTIHHGDSSSTNIWTPRGDGAITTIAHISKEIVAISDKEEELIGFASLEIL